MAELCDLLFQANWPEAKQQPSMFGSCLRVNLAMTGTCALCSRSETEQCASDVCAIVHCSMRISALCDETAADGLSTPLGSLQSTLPDSQGSQGWLGRCGSYWTIQKVKVIFVTNSIKMCFLILQGINFFLQNR